MATDILAYFQSNWQSILIDIIIVIVIIIALIIIYKFIKKKMRCKHKFIPTGNFVLKSNEKEYPRLLSICKICNVAIHQPVYTSKQLQAMEEEDNE